MVSWWSSIVSSILLLSSTPTPDARPFQRGGWVNLGSNGSPITAIGLAASSPRTVYASTERAGEVYRTDDAGQSWMRAAGDLPGGPNGALIDFFPLVVDPANPLTSFIGWREKFLPPFSQLGRTMLYRTLDGGSAWQPLPVEAGPIVIDPSASVLYLGTSVGVRHSDDLGTTWGPPSGPGNVVDLALDVSNPSAVYAASSSLGVFGSRDGGASWTSVSAGIGDGVSADSIAIDPGNPRVFYVSAGPLPLPSSRQLFKTVDAGATWSLVAGQPSGDVMQVRVAASSPAAVYSLVRTVDGNRLFRSTDDGQSWADVTANLPSPTLFEIAPGDPSTVYAGTAEGLFVTTFLERPQAARPPTRILPIPR